MLIADIGEDGSLRTVRDEHVIARLGRGVDAERRISSDTADRALATLKEFKRIAESYRSDRIIAGGTSALRDAANREEFIKAVEEQTGIRITVLTGDEEAELTYQGAVSEFSTAGSEQGFAVLDIGGGSTELTVGAGMAVRSRLSLDVGCVRLTERLLRESPPKENHLQEAVDYLIEVASRYPVLGLEYRLIGVAGTVTTLAALDLGLSEYDRSKVSGHRMSQSTVQRIFDELRTKSAEGLLSYPQILKGRADILLAGVLILLRVMEQTQVGEVITSDRGLRYGMAMKESSKFKVQG